MHSTVTLVAGAAAMTLFFAGSPAWASNRVWVSGHGVDQAGCGSPAAPCRSLQYAHDAVAGGGEIDVLDPAGYGALTITKSVSIVNDGVGTAGVQASSGNAITINAGPGDTVYLRGLTIDGLAHSGVYGISFNSGAEFALANCVVRDFSFDGVYLGPATGTANVTISDTTIADNYEIGIELTPATGTATVVATIDHTAIRDNTWGLVVNGELTSGLIKATMSNSTANNNSQDGVFVAAGSYNTDLSIDLSHMDGNTDGILAGGYAFVHLSRSTMSENTQYGLINQLTVGAGSMLSTLDNHIVGNGIAPTSGPLPTGETLY
jgi:hypothetical protein